MMYRPLPLAIGLRYTRAKRRNHFISFISLISMLGIALGVIALIVVLSVMNGFHKEVRSRILGMTAHASILGVDGSLQDWSKVAQLASQHPRVLDAAPYIEFQSMLVNGSRVTGAMIRGVLPKEEIKVSTIAQSIRDGQLDDLEQDNFSIILGKELAAVLGVVPGDKVTLVAPEVQSTPAGMMPRFKRFTLSGIFEVGMGEYDRGVALISQTDAARILRMGNAVTGVRLKLADMDQAPWVAREIAARLPGAYRVVDWTMQHRNFFRALSMEKRMMGIILFLIVAVAAFNIVSTLVMVVTDKRADIAILRTLGLSPGEIMGVFMVQGTFIGLVGVILGLVGGILLAFNVNAIVSWIELLFNIKFLDPNIYYISDLPSDPHWSDILVIGLGAFGLTVFATLYPAWRGARTQPAEALRYE